MIIKTIRDNSVRLRDCPTCGIVAEESVFVTKTMDAISFHVQKELCEECCLALQRFIGKMDGVDSILVADGKIEIVFDNDRIAEIERAKIVRNSMQKLGYRILDEA